MRTKVQAMVAQPIRVQVKEVFIKLKFVIILFVLVLILIRKELAILLFYLFELVEVMFF
jgi:hypothetical protein